jgi:hypothetical protein
MVIGKMKEIDTNKSPTILKYKKTMHDILKMYDPSLGDRDIDEILDYSISKRYQEYPCKLDNNYTKKVKDKTVLQMADYIASKEPIVTSHGTMFKKHTDVENPMGKVIQQFLDLRSQHKKQMFKFPKGSEDFEKYNLLQALTKMSRAAREVTL